MCAHWSSAVSAICYILCVHLSVLLSIHQSCHPAISPSVCLFAHFVSRHFLDFQSAISELQIVREDGGPAGPSTREMMGPFSDP